MLYHISYDLNRPGKDYPDLYKAIKEIGPWCHPLDSTWYVETTNSASVVVDKLRAVVDTSDSFVVTTAKAPGAWYGLSDEISAWFRDHLKQ